MYTNTTQSRYKYVCIVSKHNKTGNMCVEVTFRGVRVTVVPVAKKYVLHIPNVCL